MTREQALWVRSLTERDMVCKQLKQRCQELEEDYERILKGLTEEERTVLERYISLCEEMDHRRLWLVMATVGDS